METRNLALIKETQKYIGAPKRVDFTDLSAVVICHADKISLVPGPDGNGGIKLVPDCQCLW